MFNQRTFEELQKVKFGYYMTQVRLFEQEPKLALHPSFLYLKANLDEITSLMNKGLEIGVVNKLIEQLYVNTLYEMRRNKLSLSSSELKKFEEFVDDNIKIHGRGDLYLKGTHAPRVFIPKFENEKDYKHYTDLWHEYSYSGKSTKSQVLTEKEKVIFETMLKTYAKELNFNRSEQPSEIKKGP